MIYFMREVALPNLESYQQIMKIFSVKLNCKYLN